MLEVAIITEGQNGLTWPRWQKIVQLVEDTGIVGLFRSDHFTNSNPPDPESLELWTSLTGLADPTQRIEFGSLEPKVRFYRFEEGMDVVTRLLQWLNLDDLDGLIALAKAVL